MTALRRTACTLALTLTAILAGTGSTAPAEASFADSSAATTAIATAVVAAPTNVAGSLVCGRSSATMGVTWNPSTAARVSGYTVTVYFSDGFSQKKEVGPAATSWSAPIELFYVTAESVSYSVTTRTDYGWTTESAPTGAFQC